MTESTRRNDGSAALEMAIALARREEPPRALATRIARHATYREHLGRELAKPPTPRLTAVLAAGLALATAAGVALWLRHRPEPPITAEHAAAPAASTSAASTPTSAEAAKPDPCSARVAAAGTEPLIDDFEDGDDAIALLEGRVGHWRWARETDAPGTAPALLPIPRPGATPSNRHALHVKGRELVDWGATVEFTFQPPCYDAGKYQGISFEARGPGRIYVAPRETTVIPVEEGGVCEHDCHNAHVAKVELGEHFRKYVVRWTDVRQRGPNKRPLDPRRLNSLAFLIRPEDTPYDVWIDDVRFVP